MKPNAVLQQSYLDARYVVHLDEGGALQLSLGHATPALDAIGRPDAHYWALLNPGNPRSAPWPEGLNTRRMDTLQRLLRQRGLSQSPAESYAEDGSWSERGVLIHAITQQQLDALAIRFGQHAVIIGGASLPATLRLYGRGWPDLC